MKSYQTARRICTVLEWLGWACFVLGVGWTFAFASQLGPNVSPGRAFTFLSPFLFAAVVGLLFVGAVQGWRSSVDTAEYTQQMLKIARDQLEVSRQGLAGRKIDVPTFATQVGDANAQPGPSFSDAVASDADGRSGDGLSVAGLGNEALPAPDQTKSSSQSIEYQGEEISQSPAGFLARGVHFDTLEDAQKFLDERIRVDRAAAKTNMI